MDGIYKCTTLLIGKFVGALRIGEIYPETRLYSIREIWAFAWVPFDETNSFLSSDVVPNLTLNNSVHILSNPTEGFGLKSNTLFSTGPAVNCFWKMDLKTSLHVKAVLVIGDWETCATTC
jgi:hypothetical protein